MNIQIITAPLIGGLIGLITNSLAIKMLFRPYKAIRIAGFHVPFTPGLIPKEKPRIAHAIAQIISNYILDQETIYNALTSDSIKKAYENKYDEKYDYWKSMNLTFGELLHKYQLEESAASMKERVCDSISSYLIEQCKQEELARKLIEYAFIQFKDNMNPWMYKMGKKALNAAQEAMIQQAETMIDEEGKEFISNYFDDVYMMCLDKPVSDAAILLENKFPNLKQIIWEKYTELLQNKFGKFVSALNVEGIIENRINEYELDELEKMIMEISKKELNALVWLGGLLGIIMGFVNLLFN